MHALLSIHDVMPHTLTNVQRIIDQLTERAISPACVYLLVVPGREWTETQLGHLREWQQQGFELAGHGWHHKTPVKGFYHRLHSRLLSKHVAEHLALDADGIAELIDCNHAWFVEHEFRLPQLYVAPAWAMGRIARSRLKALPFRYYEGLFGLFDSITGHYRMLPLAGFQAFTRRQATGLYLWNVLNRWLSAAGRPLRISIHPEDPDLYLNRLLSTWLRRIDYACHYRELFTRQGGMTRPV